MDFRNVEKKYRPVPFWSWNERLQTEQTRQQVALMDEAGVGGFFMHARGGLLTPYMGDEWFDNARAAIEEARARGMHPWAYDENGWPSGFGNGMVNGRGEAYWQKYLTWEPVTEQNREAPRTLAVIDGRRYYYGVNELYVDVLDREVIHTFLQVVHEEYYRRLGNSFEGFFTDEPQMSRGVGGYPWSLTLPESFRARYGYELLPRLDELFFDKGDYQRTRVDFMKLLTELFSENYFKQIGDWCRAHGYGFTGHLMMEENLHSQLVSSGAAMPHYEYFTVPGMDFLGRPLDRDPLTPLALGSAAAQMGQRQVLSETFACSGHNVPHGELKRIYEWQMVRGVNLLCTHLEGYSLRGLRKRDYPPAMYYQQPWWEDMSIFFDAVSRIGKLLAEGEIVADTLLLHPQASAWALFRGADNAEANRSIAALNKSFTDDIHTLECKHVLFHLGDEIMMERHGRVEGATLVIGQMRYTRIVLPQHTVLLPSTERLLAEFRRGGGEVLTADQVPDNAICERNELTYTCRRFDGMEMHYFVNSTTQPIDAQIACGNLCLIPETGETVPFDGRHHFPPFSSLVVLDTHAPRQSLPARAHRTPLSLAGQWEVADATYNSITLDRCDYAFDGVTVGENAYVLDILPRLNELRRPVQLTQTYRFTVREVPQVIYLATETPQRFAVTCNGRPVDSTDHGSFRDSSFRLLSLAGLVQPGENTLIFTSTVSQPQSVLEHLSRSWTCETMSNSLSYEQEIEPIYLVGEFGAEIGEIQEELPRGAYRIGTEPPVITGMPRTVDVERLELSGFPEFAGTLTLTRRFTLTDTARTVYLRGQGINAVHLSVNGREVACRLYAPYEVDLTPYLVPGENTLTLRLLNNLRNMQGPHHHKNGEPVYVSPGAFYRESNVFNHGPGATEACHSVLAHWDDRICLVHFGMLPTGQD